VSVGEADATHALASTAARFDRAPASRSSGDRVPFPQQGTVPIGAPGSRPGPRRSYGE
jgi:hypothetical protein